MGESSLFEHFKKAFSKYAVALAILFALTAIANVAYQVKLYQDQGEAMIGESIDAYLTQRADMNQLLIIQFLENDQILEDFPLDRNPKKFAESVMIEEFNTIDLFYLRNDWESSFLAKKALEKEFLPMMQQIEQGSIHRLGDDYYLFSTDHSAGKSVIVGERIDQAFLDRMTAILPLSIAGIELNAPIIRQWNQSEFSFPLFESGATLQITTQLDIKSYLAQSIAFPAVFFLIGAILLFHMFKNETERINPFIETTRNALVEIGMGQTPTLPDSEVEEANLLYGSVQSLFRQLKLKDTQVKQSHLEMIQLLNAAIGTNDAYTNGHSQRVESIASRFGDFIQYEDADTLAVAARLHDIGKLGIPTNILNKPGKLDDEEFSQIKGHPTKGAEILSRSEFFELAVPLVRHHHEHWDGSGYPDGLKSAEIPLGAQILTLADVYDALTTDRPYRKALSHTEALRILRDESGSTFNPVLTDHFISFIDQEDQRALILEPHSA